MVAVALMWSIAGVVTRHLEHARSFEITFWRSFFTVLSLVVILPVWRGRKALTELPWRSGLFWLSGVCWAVMFTAFMLALTLTTVANVLVTLAIGPLLTALFSRLFIGHALPVRTWMAIVAAGSGMPTYNTVTCRWGRVGLVFWWLFAFPLRVPPNGP